MNVDEHMAKMFSEMLQKITDFALGSGVSPAMLSNIYLEAAMNTGARSVLDVVIQEQDERIATLKETDAWKSAEASREAFMAQRIRDSAAEDEL